MGYLANPTTLWYVLGGYYRASFDFDFIGRTDFGGYFVGGGVETQLAGGWSVRGEYRFTQFDTETLDVGCGMQREARGRNVDAQRQGVAGLQVRHGQRSAALAGRRAELCYLGLPLHPVDPGK